METIYKPEQMILEVIRRDGPLSRADICRQVALSFPAVSANVKVLLEKGLLCEKGTGNNAMGRKSTLLGFNQDYGYIVGMKLDRHGITEMLWDLFGHPLLIQSKDRGRPFTDIRQIQEDILSLSRKLLSEKTQGKVLCVSVSLPGAIDQETGEIHMMPYLPRLSRGDLTDAIGKVFGKVEILFENNVNNGALGEQWQGAGKGYQDIFYFHYDIGMGGAIILRNHLWKGSHQAAGEIGYMKLDASAPHPAFQMEGAAEQALSGHAVLSRLQEQGTAESLDAWFDHCDAEDPHARWMLDRLMKDIGILLVNVTATLDPQIIILAGRMGRRMFRHGEEFWLQMLKAHVPYVPRLVCSKMDGMESLYGAAKVGLAYLEKRNFMA